MKNAIKLSVAAGLLTVAVGSVTRTTAYPPFVRQASKFGAKDCTFCHTNPSGGEGWNARGNFLIAEKDRRKADSIDVEWLADYKEGTDATGDKKEGDVKEGEKKPDTPPPADTKPDEPKDADKKADEMKDTDKKDKKDKKNDQKKGQQKPPQQ